MATTLDPITQKNVDIGAQDVNSYNQDVLGQQAREARMAKNRLNAGNTADSSVTIPNIPTPTTAASISGTTQSIIDQKLAQNELNAKKEADQSKNDLLSLQNQITGVQESRGQLEKDYKVEELAKQSNDAFTKLQASQRAQTKAIQDLEKNTQGLFGGALEQEKQRINREFATEQADYAIQYDVANRNYAGAQDSVERKIKLALEPLQTKLQFQTEFYRTNQANLSDATKTSLQNLIAKNEREYNTEKDRLTEINKVLLEAAKSNAPIDVIRSIQQAGSVADAVAAAGPYYGAQQRFENDLKLAQFGLDQANTESLIYDRSNPATKPPTEGQLKAATFSNRLAESNKIINDIGFQFTSGASYAGQLLPNFLKSEERQKFEQAQRNFINAVLRRESGAVISDEEFSNARQQYFPQPGDSTGVIRQKAANRNTVILGMIREAGNGVNVDPVNVIGGGENPLNLDNAGSDASNAQPKKSSMRTDRHNNPAAFTTDIAKNAGLKLGVDYEVGDPFSGGKYHTARLIGDPVAQTIKVINNIGFYTQGGKPRWSYLASIPEHKKWSQLSYDQKKQVIAKMYSHEGGSQLKSLFA